MRSPARRMLLCIMPRIISLLEIRYPGDSVTIC
jgi:hypothetical protein